MDDESKDVDVQSFEYKIFYSTEEVDKFIAENEMKQTTKFILNRVCKSYGGFIGELRGPIRHAGY